MNSSDHAPDDQEKTAEYWRGRYEEARDRPDIRDTIKIWGNSFEIYVIVIGLAVAIIEILNVPASRAGFGIPISARIALPLALAALADFLYRKYIRNS